MAVDRRTRNAVRKYAYSNLNSAPTIVESSILTTASNLLIVGDDQKNLIIFSANERQILHHHEVNGGESGGIVTYWADGKQYVAFDEGDSLYTWSGGK
jgi:hypothetical protein